MTRTSFRVEGIRVGTSNVGHGVFATRKFRRNQQIAEIRGDVIDLPDYTSEYCIETGDGRVLEPHSPFRFLNHNCEPNCKIWYFDTPDHLDNPRLYLYALHTIHVGQELTIDYEWPESAAIRCLCGAPTCRGWIVRPEDLEQVLAREARQERVGKRGEGS